MDLAGRTTLVTGGGGFLGKHLVGLLRSAGAQVLVSRKSEHDLTDRAAVRSLLAQAKPSVVIHLAAEVGGIQANRLHPGSFFYTNMAMGLHVIEESRLVGVEKLVQVGTACAYPKHTPVPFRETDLWNGYPEETNAPYGIAKKALLVMLQGYREQYGFNGIHLVPANLYGPGDNFDPETSHVIPALIRRFVTARDEGAEEVELWGTGAPSREFLYVEDAARAILLATTDYDGSHPVNLGTGSELRISDLAALIARLTGFEGAIRWDATRPDGQSRRSLDTRRARELFGFEARTPLEFGLGQTIAWWQEHRAVAR